MKILVTGSEGFTGQHFIRYASSVGHEIVTLNTDIRDICALEKDIAELDFDSAINFAAISSVDHGDLSEIYSVNVIGAMNILDAIHSSNKSTLKSIVLVSSAHVYGNHEGAQYDEAHPLKPNNHYATSKLSMELMAQTYMNKLPILITRPFNYTGPGHSTDFIIPKIVQHFLEKKEIIELGNLETEREYNDIRFICRAYLALLEYGKLGEVYNLCTGLTYRLKDILSIIEKITGHELDITVNKKFIRKNDIQKLSGNPQKLNLILDKAGVSKQKYSLEETLTFMLENEL
ncbi:GDP-mannose 4,6-dehydratase [Gammaproteobacteria bacterium]|nr:GDP-mannose 4,6-dehydratase [Gammaproteobacteria bacterium]